MQIHTDLWRHYGCPPAILFYRCHLDLFKPPPPVGAGGGYMFSGRPSMCACVRACVRDSRGSFVFPRYLQYLLADFRQTLLSLVHLGTQMTWLRFWVKRSKFKVTPSQRRRTALDATVECSTLPSSATFSSFFFPPPNLRGHLADRHRTLPCVRWWPMFIKFGQKFEWPLPPKFGSPKTSKFGQLRNLIANISRTQQDIISRYMALQTTDTHAQADLIRYTLVHKQRKIGLEFWPTQRAAIRLGIATHLVSVYLTVSHPLDYMGVCLWRLTQTCCSTCLIYFFDAGFLLGFQQIWPWKPGGFWVFLPGCLNPGVNCKSWPVLQRLQLRMYYRVKLLERWPALWIYRSEQIVSRQNCDAARWSWNKPSGVRPSVRDSVLARKKKQLRVHWRLSSVTLAVSRWPIHRWWLRKSANGRDDDLPL